MAVPLSRSFVQFLYEQLKFSGSWDSIIHLDDATKAAIRWVVEKLGSVNGKTIKKPLRKEGLRIAVDTSDFSHAATVSDLATGRHLFNITSPIAPMLRGQSSTLRESWGISLLVREAVSRARSSSAKLKHCAIRVDCINDNQGAVANSQNMRARSMPLLQAVHHLYDLTLTEDIEITMNWQRRNTPEMQAADALSRVYDVSDFRLSKRFVEDICNQKLPPILQQLLGREQWGIALPIPSPRSLRIGPTFDALASASNVVARRYFSKDYDPAAQAQNAYEQRWPAEINGERQLYWVFPGPISDPSLAIRKLREEGCDAILIVPKFSKQSWVATLKQIPIQASFQLNGGHFKSGMYQAGDAFPPELKKKNITRPLTAYFVSHLHQ